VQVVFGIKAHSGWAALVALGRSAPDAWTLVDRRRLDLLIPEEMAWAKQPYHAAEGLSPGDAKRLIARARRAARRGAERALRVAAESTHEAGHTIAACAVLSGAPMPSWSVEEIRAVHMRMHQAEGALFRDLLAGAAARRGLRVIAVPEKTLGERARRALGIRHAAVVEALERLGKAAGPPWGKDQKDAALAAVLSCCFPPYKPLGT
jgi:hypothetical protein